MRRCYLGRRILPTFFATLLVGGVAVLTGVGGLELTRTAAAPVPFSARQALLPESLRGQIRLRVRITDSTPSVKVRGFDLAIHDNDREGSRAQRGPAVVSDRAAQWDFHCQYGRVRAHRDGARETLELREPVSIDTPAGFLSFNGKPYREGIRIFSAGSFCEVINVLDIEKYLDGLVNAEFSAKWTEAAVEAQVIAARTYAVYQAMHARKSALAHFDLDSTIADQVYDGAIREDFRASRAVQRTRGQILTAQRDDGTIQPIKAFYHSTCGGHTDLPENVWGSAYAGFKHAATCPFCTKSPLYSWQNELTVAEMTAKLKHGFQIAEARTGWGKRALLGAQSGHLVDLKVTKFDLSGRVKEVLTVWSDGAQVSSLALTGNQFREWVGASRLKSTQFQIWPLGDRFRLSGRGFGHGVGMCQWGAKVMGERGFNLAAILKQYYPDAGLKQYW